MAKLDFDPSAIANMFSGVATTETFKVANTKIPLTQDLRLLKPQLEGHRKSWNTVTVTTKLTPELGHLYSNLYLDLDKAISELNDSIWSPDEKYKALYEILEHSHRFLIALPEPPTTPPPKPKPSTE
jgi:hypothetical protein